MNGIPADQAARTRLSTELDVSFFVEAGAGTGKTHELVSRIVALVAADRVRMEGLAAITFTEAAAQELRDRIRQEVEAAAGDAARAPAERERCGRAAREIDRAAIQTIHAFAGSLLRAFPLEAGLPPNFETWDEIQRDLAFEERFRAWLYEEVPAGRRPGLRAAVRRVLALGMSPDRLRDLAASLQEHRDLLGPDTTWACEPPPDPLDTAHQLGEELLALQALLPLARNGPEDELAQEVSRVQFPARGLASARGREEALAALQGLLVCHPRQRGRQADWVAEGPEHPVKRIKTTFRESLQTAAEVLAAHRTAALTELLGHLRDFTLAYAAERRRQGVVTFHDLLVGARDLLRDHPGVRASAHGQYRCLFIDEFQDTDPLQAEIAWFLAADPASAPERDWRRLQPTPGRLFLVGDPKQSIYRFRRADISVYQEARARLGGPAGTVLLVQNFRSAAPVLAWVNHQLAREMQARPGVQAAFAELAPRPPRLGPEIEAGRCGVYYFGAQSAERASTRWWLEARAVAETARRVVDEGWPVSSRDQEGPRPARFGDICVLIPSRTNLRGLERAFEDWHVPYRMESGSLVLHTQEVRDLLACLRAIDDPSDQVALVAALRSPAYACSDVELLEWVEAGGRLEYEQPGDGCPGRVREALASLLAFHQQRLERSAAAMVDAFVRERLLAVGAFGHARPREAWRRLRYVASRARAFAVSGRPGLRAFLDWMETLQQRASYEPESAGPEGDEEAVRIMTIHGAKGLEFPLVILTGLGSGSPRYHGDIVVAPDRERGTTEVRGGDFQTQGYSQEREDQMQEAERVRLLYVAATRARDYLVLSLYRGKDACSAQRIALGLEEGVGLARKLALGGEPPPAIRHQVPGTAGGEASEHARAEREWLEGRRALIAALASERTIGPSQLARASLSEPGPSTDEESSVPGEAEEGEEGEEAAVLASRGEEAETARARRSQTAAVGSAVHAVLEAVNLATLEDLDLLSRRLAAAHGVSDRREEVRALARAAASSRVIQRALAGGKYWREVPVGTEVLGTLLAGRIDLLYENPDGSLGIVDYKTDRVSRAGIATRAATYRLQAGAYALAVQRATGRAVASVEFVFAAREGATVEYGGEEVSSLVAEAEAALQGLSAGPRA